jgi:hypothetical protein
VDCPSAAIACALWCALVQASIATVQRGASAKKLRHLQSRPLAAEHHRPVRRCSMRLKHVLGQTKSNPMMLTAAIDASLLAALRHPLPWHFDAVGGASAPSLGKCTGGWIEKGRDASNRVAGVRGSVRSKPRERALFVDGAESRTSRHRGGRCPCRNLWSTPVSEQLVEVLLNPHPARFSSTACG